MEQEVYSTLTETLDGLGTFLPEIALVASILLIFALETFTRGLSIQWSRVMGIGGFMVVLGLSLLQWPLLDSGNSITLFEEMLILDRLSVFFKILFSIAGILVLLFPVEINGEPRQVAHRFAVFAVLILFMALGGHLLLMASNLLMAYMAIEVLSISGYLITFFRFEKYSGEGGIKYLIFGGVSSAVMLYGFSFLYGLGGTLDFTNPDFFAQLSVSSVPLLVIAILMSLAGILFKLSAIPMHFWAPDAYRVAPTGGLAFISVVPKIAALVLLIRLTPGFSDILAATPLSWMVLMATIAMITMTAGNAAALSQKNALRLMAYSGVAHTGFLLIGVVVLTEYSFYAVVFYAVIFALANLGTFLLLSVYRLNNPGLEMSRFHGLGFKAALPAVLLLIGMIALTGLPPTAGFSGKLLLFSSVWESYQSIGNTILTALLILGILNTVVALGFYLKIPYLMFFRPLPAEAPRIQTPSLIIVFSAMAMFLLLYIFFQPDSLMRWINSINFAL